MLQLKVGIGADDDVSGGGKKSLMNDLQHWLSDLKQTVESKEQQFLTSDPLIKSMAVDPGPDYDKISRHTIFHIRDQAQCQLSLVYHRFLKLIYPDRTLQNTELCEKALQMDDFAAIKTQYDQPVQALEKYYALQAQLTSQLEMSSMLEKQWMSLPTQSSEIPQTRTVIQKLFQTSRDAHQEWLQLSRQTMLKLWQLRVDLIDAYQVLVNDTVKGFEAEGDKIMKIYEDVRTEIDHQIKQSANNDFYQDYARLSDHFRFWLNSISGLLPASLRFQQQVTQFLEQCNVEEDPCCLKRVRHMKDQVDRIYSFLMLHRDTHQHRHLETASLQSELSMTTATWEQTQSQLKSVQDELHDLSQKRVSLWTQDQTIPALELLEQRQLELEKKQEVLLDKIAPLRAAMERLRSQNTEVRDATQMVQALDQCEEWKGKLQTFQQRCEQESELWSQGRGLQYRARFLAQEETAKALQSLYTTAQQKIDGAGLALLRYGLMVIQSIWASGIIHSQTLQQKLRTSAASLHHYLQRLAMSYPGMAELINQQFQAETEIHNIQSQIEEIQLENLVHTLLKSMLQKVS